MSCSELEDGGASDKPNPFTYNFNDLYEIRLYPSRPNPRRKEKIKSNFYFHTSLRCLKKPL